MRIAFVGTSHVHTLDYLAVCRSVPWVDLVGVARPDPDTLATLTELPAVFDRQEDLPDHDIAVILTDAADHDQVCERLTAPAVFIEKPLAVSHERAQSISDLLTARSIETEVGFFLRHLDAFKSLTNACRCAEMGRVRFARFAFAHSGILDGWLQQWPAHVSAERMGGGAFVDLAIHLIDAASNLLGPFDVRSCELDMSSSSRYGFANSFETQGHATLASNEGALVHIWASAEAPTTMLRIEFISEGGEITLDAGRVVRRYHTSEPEVLHDGSMPTPADGLRAAIEGFKSRSTRIVYAKDAVAASRLVEELLQLKRKAQIVQTGH